jgi:hypothetical protein
LKTITIVYILYTLILFSNVINILRYSGGYGGDLIIMIITIIIKAMVKNKKKVFVGTNGYYVV